MVYLLDKHIVLNSSTTKVFVPLFFFISNAVLFMRLNASAIGVYNVFRILFSRFLTVVISSSLLYLLWIILV